LAAPSITESPIASTPPEFAGGVSPWSPDEDDGGGVVVPAGGWLPRSVVPSAPVELVEDTGG
jgi:hypothetical protein